MLFFYANVPQKKKNSLCYRFLTLITFSMSSCRIVKRKKKIWYPYFLSSSLNEHLIRLTFGKSRTRYDSFLNINADYNCIANFAISVYCCVHSDAICAAIQMSAYYKRTYCINIITHIVWKPHFIKNNVMSSFS